MVGTTMLTGIALKVRDKLHDATAACCTAAGGMVVESLVVVVGSLVVVRRRCWLGACCVYCDVDEADVESRSSSLNH